MPRIQVYLPDDLYRAVKERGLPASALLQEAVRVELRRLQLLEATDEYVAGITAEAGEPSPTDLAWAQALVRRVTQHAGKAAS
ncbi:MAG: hypothetical protein FJW79_11830 [Actinobacteria bacterium]|nr:hypothetical protein [Actinomycetota bacterium]